eukprot:2141743-Alexandrium_andersonii.AAC.1
MCSGLAAWAGDAPPPGWGGQQAGGGPRGRHTHTGRARRPTIGLRAHSRELGGELTACAAGGQATAGRMPLG